MRTHRLAAWVLGISWLACPSDARAAGGPPAPPRPAPARPAVSGTVSGIVTDEEGRPLAGATVRVQCPGVAKPATGTSDGKGFYAVRGLPTGPATVVVRAKGRIAVSREVAIPSTGIAVADAQLLPGVRFAGKVVDLRGAPVGDVRILAFQGGEGGRGDFGSFFSLSRGDATRSQPDGSYELDGVAPGAAYTLRFVHPRYASVDLPGLDATPGGGHDALEAILEDAAWVTGTVVGTDGKPIVGADVSGGEDPFSVGRNVGWFSLVLSLLDEDATPPSDAKGRFLVGGLTEESVRLQVRAEGHFPADVEVTGLTPGTEKAGLVVRMETATATVEGVVLDDKEQPIPSAEVTAWHGDDVVGHATSDARGRFRLTRVASKEPVRLTAAAGGHAAGRADDVALDAKDARVTCRRLGRLEVTVLGADGKPLGRVLVRALAGGQGRGTSVWAEAKAGKVVAELPLGEVQIELSAEGYETSSLGKVEVEPGETVTPDPVTLAKASGKDPPSEGGD